MTGPTSFRALLDDRSIEEIAIRSGAMTVVDRRGRRASVGPDATSAAVSSILRRLATATAAETST